MEEEKEYRVNRVLKVALFGFGRAGQIHFKNLLTHGDYKLEYIVERSEIIESVKKQIYCNLLAKNISVIPLEELKEKVYENSEIEAVFICSPTSLHVEQIKDSLSNNKHIFCEKPISMNVAEISSCYKISKSAQKTLFCALNRRCDPYIQELKSLICSKALGTLHTITTTARDHPYPSSAYLETSGGIFHDCGTHDIDICNWLTSARPTHVFAAGTKTLDKTTNPLNLDTALITLFYADNMLATIHLSRMSSSYDQRISVFGSEREMMLDNINPFPIEIEGRKLKQNVLSFQKRYALSYVKELQVFYEAVVEGKECGVGEEDAVNAAIVANACEEAWKERRVVEIDYMGF
jgi:myo-inositol 2-dehydrogenase / D-chiro-inositol 1-dehydrogenase